MAMQRIEQPFDRTPLTKEGLDSTAEQLRLLDEFVRDRLVIDQDYGVIPGTGGKPTLLKPGAANVISAFNCHIDGDDKCALEILDPERGKYGFVAYRIVVRIVSNVDGSIRAMGQGSANSHESKWRYRNAQPVCPSCGKENIRASRDGNGYYCWAKTGGCGATYPNGDKRIESQPVGKVENENPLDQANTILKIAIKRATTDAALQLPGVARFFTQDLDDMAPTASQDTTQAALSAKPAPQAAQAPQKPVAPPARPPQPAAPQPLPASGEMFPPPPTKTANGNKEMSMNDWKDICPVHDQAWQSSDRGHWHPLKPTGTCERTPVLTPLIKERIAVAASILQWDQKQTNEFCKQETGKTWSALNTDGHLAFMERLEYEANLEIYGNNEPEPIKATAKTIA